MVNPTGIAGAPAYAKGASGDGAIVVVRRLRSALGLADQLGGYAHHWVLPFANEVLREDEAQAGDQHRWTGQVT